MLVKVTIWDTGDKRGKQVTVMLSTRKRNRGTNKPFPLYNVMYEYVERWICQDIDPEQAVRYFVMAYCIVNVMHPTTEALLIDWKNTI